MPLTIGSNIASLQGQRRLAQAENQLGRTFERLSSGLRINRASDDAAGLAIASDLQSSRRVYSQGIRNINDGLSLLSIADSAVEELTSIVTRVRELAQQSANGSFSNTQRVAIDSEAQALAKEYFRIARSTSFNDTVLFDGSLENGLRLQAGYGVDGSVQSNLGGSLGTGTFTGTITATSTVTTQGIALGDLNSDGILDMVTIDDISRIGVSLGVGDGTFGSTVHGMISAAPFTEVQLTDFNDDGVLDILASLSSGAVVTQLGVGDGSFGSQSTIGVGGFTSDVKAGDFNGDGFTDIVAANRVGSSLTILLGNGDGSFVNSGSIASGTPNSLAIGDINGDGVLDIVSGRTGNSNINIHYGVGDGTFSAASTTSAAASEVALVDMNGDGNLDIVGAAVSSDSVMVFLNNGNGTFASPTSVGTEADPTDLATGDFNGDGFLDAVTTSAFGGNVNIHYGDGAGGFAGDVNSMASILPTSVAVGDTNGDGVLDLVASISGGAGVRSYIGDVRDGIGLLVPFSLKTKADALQAIAPLERNLSKLSEQRGMIGAFQSRLASAVGHLGSTIENYAAAESRIRDVDIAEESANAVRLTILRSAASSVLAQSNLSPEIAVQLLGQE